MSADLLSLFDRSNRAAGLSPATRQRFYNSTLSAFYREGGENTRESVEEFLARRRERGVGDVSINTYWRAFSRYYTWAVERGHLPVHPLTGMKKPILPPPDSRIPSDATLRRVLEGTTNPRDRLALLLGIDGGLRRGEAAGLRVEDIDWDRFGVVVTGKGRKVRRVGLDRVTMQVLIQVVGKRTSGPVFLTQTGEPLTEYGFREIWDRIKVRFGLDFRYHDLRHYSATMLAYSGRDPWTIRDRLGHTSTRMTERYVHLAGQLREEGSGHADRLLGRGSRGRQRGADGTGVRG